MTTITIANRFRGPEESGNGGYTCGMVANFVEGQAEVTLRRPPPLDKPLSVERIHEGVEVFDGETLIAQGVTVNVGLDVPGPPTLAEAVAARERYTGYRDHAFPVCFVCGTERAEDGLMIHAGQVEGREVWASPFTPDLSLPSEHGLLRPEMIWSALDCPGAWAVERATQEQPVVLGRMTALLERDAPLDRTYIAIGWPIGGEGRKLFSGTALFDDVGARYGWALQTWIVLT